MNKKRVLTLILTVVIAASLTALMTGCAASVTYLDGAGPESGAAAEADSTAADSDEDEDAADAEDESSEAEDEESEEEESAEEEESEEESSEEEESEEKSSEEESSEAEEEESSEAAEESKAEDNAEGAVIKFKKPDSWGDGIKAYVYLSDADKNANWPGEAMTDNGDGTYSYNVDKHFMEGTDPKVVFNDGKNQAPKSGGFIVKDGQEYDENYSD